MIIHDLPADAYSSGYISTSKARTVERSCSVRTETMKTLSPSSRAICLQRLVICGSPAGIKVYPGGAVVLKESCK